MAARIYDVGHWRLRCTTPAANALISEATSLDLLRTVDISQVDKCRSHHFLLQASQIKPSELWPLCHDDYNIGTVRAFVGVVDIFDLG